MSRRPEAVEAGRSPWWDRLLGACAGAGVVLLVIYRGRWSRILEAAATAARSS